MDLGRAAFKVTRKTKVMTPQTRGFPVTLQKLDKSHGEEEGSKVVGRGMRRAVKGHGH